MPLTQFTQGRPTASSLSSASALLYIDLWTLGPAPYLNLLAVNVAGQYWPLQFLPSPSYTIKRSKCLQDPYLLTNEALLLKAFSPFLSESHSKSMGK